MAAIAAIAAAWRRGGAAAEDRLQTILARGHIIVGTGSTNPPWHFKDDAGTLVGYDVDMGHLLAKAIFDDPDQGRVRHPVVGFAHPERAHRQGRHHLPVHDGDRRPRPAGRLHHPLLSRRRRPAPDEERQVQELRRGEGRRQRRDHLGPAERLCRGAGPPGAARGQGRPVRQRRPHLPGAEFRPRRRRRHRHVVGASGSSRRTPTSTSRAATAGARRPIPARSRRAISTSCTSSTSPSARR